MQTTLNNKIWVSDDKINPEVRKNLLQIAKDFVKFVKIKHLKICDITITGSLADYTWNDRSDIDLHIVFNLKNFERHRRFVNEYLQAKKATWNHSHEIKMHDFKVELYPQDMEEPENPRSTYSLVKDVWITKPDIKNQPQIDKTLIRKKYQDKVDAILYFEELVKKSKMDYKKLIAATDKFLDDIDDKRNQSLKTDGIHSTENIVFKLLRNNGFIDKLKQLKKDIYDKALTIKEKQSKGV